MTAPIGVSPTTLLTPSAMVNLIGHAERPGKTLVWAPDAIDYPPSTYVHLYGKDRCWDGRKMGHITALGPSSEVALERAQQARSKIRITAYGETA